MPKSWRSGEAAEAIGTERLVDCDLYVTLEPCTMCAAAISFARVRRLYYGAADPKGGAVESGVRFFASPTCHHVPEVYSAVGETEAATLVEGVFQGAAVMYLPLPLAGEVDARSAAGGGNLSTELRSYAEAPPPRPSPASGRGGAPALLP